MPIPGSLPARILSGDLDGDGRGDLVVADAGSNVVLVFLQRPSGGFGAPDARLATGKGPSDLLLMDADGDGGLDLLVTNYASGDVSLILNHGGGRFAPEVRFRAGTAIYGVAYHDGAPLVRSDEKPAGVAAADVNGDGVVDVVASSKGFEPDLDAARARVPADCSTRNPRSEPTPATARRPSSPACSTATRTRMWRS